jgi:hypothetical protein
MLSPKLIIKILTMVGLVGGLIGAIKLFNSVKPERESVKIVRGKKKKISEATLDEGLSKDGIKLIFWVFLAQFAAVFCQLFYY